MFRSYSLDQGENHMSRDRGTYTRGFHNQGEELFTAYDSHYDHNYKNSKLSKEEYNRKFNDFRDMATAEGLEGQYFRTQIHWAIQHGYSRDKFGDMLFELSTGYKANHVRSPNPTSEAGHLARNIANQSPPSNDGNRII